MPNDIQSLIEGMRIATHRNDRTNIIVDILKCSSTFCCQRIIALPFAGSKYFLLFKISSKSLKLSKTHEVKLILSPDEIKGSFVSSRLPQLMENERIHSYAIPNMPSSKHIVHSLCITLNAFICSR